MPWQFRKLTDGKIAVTLDNNVWNFLFHGKIDLMAELPKDRFAISIAREVEIETLAIPDSEEKKALKDYIARTIDSRGISTIRFFGFANEGPGPERRGSFDHAVWASDVQVEFYAAIHQRFLERKGLKNSELFDNEADAAVASHSFSSIVLTCERPNKAGPLRFASENGGAILYLRNYEQSSLGLREIIEDFHQKL